MHLCALQVDLTSLYIWKVHSVSPWCVDFCCCCWDGPGEDISFFNKQKIEGIICLIKKKKRHLKESWEEGPEHTGSTGF